MIETTIAKVYRSTSAGRRFFTRKAAIHAEASALVKRKYPTEAAETDDQGRTTYTGFHWSEDAKGKRLYERLIRILTPNPKR